MVEIIEEHNVTIFVGSPTMLRMMLDQTPIEDYDLSSLRLVIVGGEMFDEKTFDEWTERSGIEPCNTVGMSQLRHWYLTPYRDGEKIAPRLSVGKPYAGFERKLVKIDEPETELETHDDVGRLAIRGPTNISYWNNIHPEMPEQMSEYTIDNWGLADDAYRQDEEGYLYFETRLDNMITSAGRQISGPEVEGTLIKHNAVSEVAVVGSPDDIRGEIVKAFVVLSEYVSPSVDLVSTLQNFVKEELAPYKYPREIEFVTQLPTDEMGKIQRAELREREYEKEAA
jgi:2-aminobenzoate-CoA ligase